FFFFFQAEDGIRDRTVTGVQTCALPISKNVRSLLDQLPQYIYAFRGGSQRADDFGLTHDNHNPRARPIQHESRKRSGLRDILVRSEERRVGKEGRSWGGGDDYKEKGEDV